ncbi:hypothetical protein E4U23_001349 [Claviceps purpurea]|nr:hypothetical protein E4U23_001349 [Claviceps purpurea]
MTDPRQSISNDAFAPGQFEESSTDEEFLEPFEEEEPEDGVDPVSRQLMREASEPRRNQRPNTRKDYLDIARSGKRKATPQKTANTTIQYYDDDIYDEEEETPRLFGFLMLEASNLADTKFEIPSSWYKAKNMANYRSFWRPAELKELQKIQEKECWTLEIPPDGAKVLTADGYTQSSTRLMGSHMQRHDGSREATNTQKHSSMRIFMQLLHTWFSYVYFARLSVLTTLIGNSATPSMHF